MKCVVYEWVGSQGSGFSCKQGWGCKLRVLQGRDDIWWPSKPIKLLAAHGPT